MMNWEDVEGADMAYFKVGFYQFLGGTEGNHDI